MVKFYTDYPFEDSGDVIKKPVEHPREIKILFYDGDKYCQILVDGRTEVIKSGYIYASNKPSRYNNCPIYNVKLSKNKKWSDLTYSTEDKCYYGSLNYKMKPFFKRDETHFGLSYMSKMVRIKKIDKTNRKLLRKKGYKINCLFDKYKV